MTGPTIKLTDNLSTILSESMRTRLAIVLTTAAAASLLAANSASAASLLAVDFGTAGLTPQAGFLELSGSVSQATASQTFGSYSVDLVGQGFGVAGAGNAAAVDESVRSLYRDYYFNNSDVNGEGVGLAINGVAPNTPYTLTLWSYDADQLFSPTDTVWAPAGNTSGDTGMVTNFADPRPANLSEYSTTIQVSSTSDKLEVFGTTTFGSGGTRLNGFRLNNGSADVLSVDFGQPLPPPSPTQPGFNSMTGGFPLGPNSPPPSLTSTFGDYTVSVSGDPYQGTDYTRIGFEHNAASAAAIDPSISGLFADALINNLDLNDGSGLTITIQGVTPNQEYRVKLWSYNADNTAYSTPTEFGPLADSATTGTTGSVTQFATPLPTTLDDFSTTIIVSSTTDTLHIHGASTDNYGGTRLNAFELSEVGEPILGDFDGSGSVNGADLILWKDNFGDTNATVAMGDADSDQDVDGADFLVWQRNVGLSNAIASVPEPSCLALSGIVGLGIAGQLWSSRRQRSRI